MIYLQHGLTTPKIQNFTRADGDSNSKPCRFHPGFDHQSITSLPHSKRYAMGCSTNIDQGPTRAETFGLEVLELKVREEFMWETF